ncbi:hypothetical protein RLEG3_06770 (plasmid) [Rhizobium leguminosarum bv. trifolii WSM1689]|nr:hypothetical protein RLEG3_06770 [Rhizobium leguminosarum bv. trifolii WSM1689]
MDVYGETGEVAMNDGRIDILFATRGRTSTALA